jgi:hypothetical protein
LGTPFNAAAGDCALADHPGVRRIVADRMAQPHGEWLPFRA